MEARRVRFTHHCESKVKGICIKFRCFGALSAPYEVHFKNCRVLRFLLILLLSPFASVLLRENLKLRTEVIQDSLES
jgi:hypothetical protein